MKKSIPIIRERESEAFILGNGREREFPLTPGEQFIHDGVIEDDSAAAADNDNGDEDGGGGD